MRRIAHHAGVRPIDPLARARRRRLALAGLALTALLLPAVHIMPVRLVWNASPSVPIGLYRVAPADGLNPGELVALRPPPGLAAFMAERRYVGAGALLVKPIAAAEGARVCRVDMRITIDGRHTAIALPGDSRGQPLPRWSGCRRLGRDELFLIAPAIPGSFDSRYFGPVPRSSVIGRAFPLWTRP